MPKGRSIWMKRLRVTRLRRKAILLRTRHMRRVVQLTITIRGMNHRRRRRRRRRHVRRVSLTQFGETDESRTHIASENSPDGGGGGNRTHFLTISFFLRRLRPLTHTRHKPTPEATLCVISRLARTRGRGKLQLFLRGRLLGELRTRDASR